MTGTDIVLVRQGAGRYARGSRVWGQEGGRAMKGPALQLWSNTETILFKKVGHLF